MSRIAPLPVITVAQFLAGTRTLARLVRSAGGPTIGPATGGVGEAARVSVIVPVLDEAQRLGPCLDGLIAHGSVVAEILVVDGGSTDGTHEIVRAYARRDGRVRLIDASPIPEAWNGKAWGLQAGIEASSPGSAWLLTVDADVRMSPLLVPSLLSHAEQYGLRVFSVATRQEVCSHAEHLLHPSLLATLVYRFGMPGQIARHAGEVQANGQCFVIRRALALESGGFAAVHDSICEDVSFARMLAGAGHQVGFFETEDLVWVRMYESAGETWRNWTRSLPMRDRFNRWQWAAGLAEVLLVQALPLPLLALLAWRGQAGWCMRMNAALVVVRLGMLVGTARAYRRRRWTYWLSPVCDLPVALQLWRRAVQRRHRWRGRMLIQGRHP